MGEPVRIELTNDEALVLFGLLHRFDDTGTLSILDQAEERALWNLQGCLEKRLVEIFDPNYNALLNAARSRLRDPAD